ncbi:Cytochrome c oxidase subunit 4 isoform 2 [Sarcoptes scabiei]|nr:Cytochrome c oxidase subunit 4 isoform 2 [Sarcoptes scabiei]
MILYNNITTQRPKLILWIVRWILKEYSPLHIAFQEEKESAQHNTRILHRENNNDDISACAHYYVFSTSNSISIQTTLVQRETKIKTMTILIRYYRTLSFFILIFASYLFLSFRFRFDHLIDLVP